MKRPSITLKKFVFALFHFIEAFIVRILTEIIATFLSAAVGRLIPFQPLAFL
jgi:hypothetical protein